MGLSGRGGDQATLGMGRGGVGDVGCGVRRSEPPLLRRGSCGRAALWLCGAVAMRVEVAQAMRRCSRRSTSMESVARRKAE